ncbi:MAG: hypothetical protein EOS58_27025 [Mesorhizobium sp.]|uniref:hypothetical protein n=1 Tax=unclassified Mesorhizobium TaxID=325217 RepID=UPI000F75513A|nr:MULTISPECIES: hypothetical protein [unclassified Mesorhizobium]RVD72516.1 hypothetical protein EN751_09710 [Mesorhizobium sp. M4A.F.Ca.ET.029.04.2.1]AZO47728.1 hypothetical protein EJ073_07725 [Mesorhizobium sp. M4B.F.Ca.ET.058.02.1.1]RVC44576.1 hypothetical protein EN781_13485 [Mesorhizobium sp. M4A.F.Ca.ET.090.04.2.1]RVC79002.1 hypothetical protein EN745_17245 [Mesorhizobium sp. M4A.F.Ca.ET.022.05.2.1]RVD39721.1 hypothetical protein EN742_14430 [Mesorhizobium sp. M4A.F.Ca.ET.020.02.1.1]
MRDSYSSQLREDLNSLVVAAIHSTGVVNVAIVAERVRLRNLDENVAREDLEYMVVQTAEMYGAAMEFDCALVVEVAEGPCPAPVSE